jgi:hypothetical protein
MGAISEEDRNKEEKEAKEALDKYKELYQSSKEVLNQERNRFKDIDDKAAKYLTIFTFFLGAAGYIGTWVVGNVLHPKTCTDCLLLITGIALIVSTSVSWLASFLILRIETTMEIPIDIKFFDENRILDIYYALARGIEDAFKKNKIVTDKKTRFLRVAHWFILTTGGLLLVFAFLYAVRSW